MSKTAQLDRDAVRIGDLMIGHGLPVVVIGGENARWLRLPADGDSSDARSDRAAGPSGLSGAAGKTAGEARARWAGPLLVEPFSAADLPAVARHADAVVIGPAWARDPGLVRAAARLGLPVILQRGIDQRGRAATLEEWLAAADDCAAEGNEAIVLCESGGRTEPAGTASHLPPSHLSPSDLAPAPDSGPASDSASDSNSGAGLALGLAPDATAHAAFDSAFRSAPDLALVRAARERTGRPVLAALGRDGGLAGAAVAAGADGLLLDPAAPPEARAAADEAATVLAALVRPQSPRTLTEARGEIDRVDAALAVLLERRALLAARIQRLKPVGGFQGRDMERERRLVAGMARRAPRLGVRRLAPIMNAVIEAGLHAAEEERARDRDADGM
ncbi:3-deoxy-D-arabinoheptulosonate-7-phosphate synthase [Microbispora cellulosiformans]|uniref:3-deoxy-D-arabinoheptulosonate-7-phosphate synthase n=1 Tax=Microbispora cellulosiformans TaxID=2614688 RepID=A0A5J5K5P6_9ACTN|nr:3-deoxy-D-arabinoheptulosonate-7-phosphate synthase [Microbispora cellulosiformans]